MQISREHLHLADRYDWTDTKKTFPESHTFDGGQGGQVLFLINQLMTQNGLTKVSTVHKIESMLQALPPGGLSHRNAKFWVLRNWEEVVS